MVIGMLIGFVAMCDVFLVALNASGFRTMRSIEWAFVGLSIFVAVFGLMTAVQVDAAVEVESEDMVPERKQV